MRKVIFVIAATIFIQTIVAQEVTLRPVVYQLPDMNKVQVKEGIEFRKVNDTSLKLDIYYPPGFNKKKNLPVVVFNNGGIMELPTWRVYRDWAKLIAANGMIAVNHQSRPNRATSVEDGGAVLDYLKQHAQELKIDAERMGIWTCSGNARVGIRLALRPGREFVRTLVVYYGGPDTLARFRQDVPTLIVRAGLDAQSLNMNIENFIQSLLQQDARVEFINYLEGMHAFDLYNNTEESKSIIKRTIEFLKKNLNEPVAILKEPVLTNRNFMWMMNNGQSAQALAAFRKAVVQYRNDPNFHPFYNGVIREDILNANAYWLLRNNKQAEGLEVFKLMVETYPASANAHDGLADAYEATGNKAEALRNAEKTLELLQKDTTSNEQFKARVRASAEEKVKRLKS